MVTKTGSNKKHLSSEHMIYAQKSKIAILKDTFIANDFPINIVDRVFQKYIPHKYTTDGRENTQKTPIDFEKSFKIPYVKGFSDMKMK